MTLLEQLQKEAREKFYRDNSGIEFDTRVDAFLDDITSQFFLAGEKSGKSEGAKIAVEYAFSRIKEEGTIEGDDIRISHEQLAGILEVGRMKARTS